MGSPRSIGATVLALGVLAMSASVVATGPATATRGHSVAAAPTTVSLNDPDGLPLGEPPAAAFITGIRGGPIYRTGADPLDVGSDQGSQDLLVRARGGYLVTQGSRTVRFVSDTGSHHDVFTFRGHPSWGIREVVTSHDGRFVAVMIRSATAEHRDTHLVVRRVSAPRTIAQRTFAMPVRVASLTGGRALLTPGGDAMVRDIRHAPTRWWRFHHHRLRTIDTSGRIGPHSDFGGFSTADLTSGQVALLRSDHNRVVPLPGEAGRSWSTRAHEWVISWSPDDRYVVTVAWTPQKPRTGNGWDTLNVRRARDGKLVTVFSGFQNLSAGPTSPAWESNTTFVATVMDTCDHGSCANRTNVRCTLHGACQRVDTSGMPIGFGFVEERRLPSS